MTSCVIYVSDLFQCLPLFVLWKPQVQNQCSSITLVYSSAGYLEPSSVDMMEAVVAMCACMYCRLKLRLPEINNVTAWKGRLFCCCACSLCSMSSYIKDEFLAGVEKQFVTFKPQEEGVMLFWCYMGCWAPLESYRDPAWCSKRLNTLTSLRQKDRTSHWCSSDM